MLSVYGGTGFVGKEFCKQFADDVYVVPRGQDDPHPNTTQVLYLISTVDNYNVLTDTQVDIQTNLSKLMRVLEKCKDKEITFNFVSSWFVYGDCQLPAKESYPCTPTGFYSITKKCAEDLLISFCKTWKINYRIFRLGNVYGPGDKKVSAKKNALQFLINKLKNHEDVSLYHGGEFFRDYIHVSDVCRLMMSMLRDPEVNNIVNISSGEKTKFIDVMNYCKEKLLSKSKFIPVEPSDFHKIVQVKDMWIDTHKLKEKGLSAHYNIWEGLNTLL